MAETERYDPKISEPKWQKLWEELGITRFDPLSKKPVFSVDTPPPTMSGRMHMGHASSYSQTDFIVRYKRMNGFNVFYPFGTDDNGLATERMVEKLKAVKATKMQRSAFVDLVMKTLDELRPEFVGDWKRLGISCDWSHVYSTIDKNCQRVSQRSFIELYNSGRQYRKNSPTIWCPECETAIAQVELQDKELPSHFVDITFELEGGVPLMIGTTRPELIAACVAIMANPDDDRYKKLVGKKVTVPLSGQKVKIIADKRVDPLKGTGAVMCCTFGDQTDIEWYRAYNLDLKVAMGKNGRMTDLCGKYAGMKGKDARAAIIEDLEAKGLVVAKKKITHAVNVHERCGIEVEILESPQWFVKYLDLKDQFLEAGARLNWNPSFMKTRLDNWIKGLQWDWCVSRQRYYGVPFPVWYCTTCKEPKLADIKDLPVDPLKDKPKTACACGSTSFEGEKDVLDTWATSSLTPSLAIDRFHGKEIYEKLFPMTLRPQAHDIIAFWLFNTLVKSLLHNNQNPWKDVAISGYVLDPHGQKMSKSKGNTLAPWQFVEKYSADALRFWAASNKLGDDVPFMEKELVSGQKVATKLWNASKFVSIHFPSEVKKPAHLEKIDEWLLSRLNRLVKDCTSHFDTYEASRTKQDVENFFMNTFCDYYLEIVKDRLYNPDARGEQAKLSGQYTIYTALSTVLKLFAPLLPHITEELYQMYFAKHDNETSIHVSAWPSVDEKLIDEDAEKLGDLVVYCVGKARRAKSEQNKSLKTPLKQMTVAGKISTEAFTLIEKDLKAATSTDKLLFTPLNKDSAIEMECEIEL